MKWQGWYLDCIQLPGVSQGQRGPAWGAALAEASKGVWEPGHRGAFRAATFSVLWPSVTKLSVPREKPGKWLELTGRGLKSKQPSTLKLSLCCYHCCQLGAWKEEPLGKVISPSFTWIRELCCAVLNRSVVSNSCDPMDCSLPASSLHGDSPGKNAGVGCHALLQGIFPTQRLNSVFRTAGGFLTIWTIREALSGYILTLFFSYYAFLFVINMVQWHILIKGF